MLRPIRDSTVQRCGYKMVCLVYRYTQLTTCTLDSDLHEIRLAPDLPKRDNYVSRGE
jgi:hypothetical protein